MALARVFRRRTSLQIEVRFGMRTDTGSPMFSAAVDMSATLHEFSPSFEERATAIYVKEDLVQMQTQNGKSTELPFLEDLAFPAVQTGEQFREILRTSQKVKASNRSRIPTSLAEFELSPELKDDLRGGCREALGAPRKDARELVERVCQETSDRAQIRKQEARTFLKKDNRDLQKSASTATRSRTRSRIEAEVSRIRDEEYGIALKRAIQWIVQNTETRHPSDCLCDRPSSKKRRRC